MAIYNDEEDPNVKMWEKDAQIVFNVIIWRYTKELFQKEVEFDTPEEAESYAKGAFHALMDLGKKPTGISVK